MGFIWPFGSTVSWLGRLWAFLVPRITCAKCFVVFIYAALKRARLFDEQGCDQGGGIGRINAFAQELTPVDRIFGLVAGLAGIWLWCHRWVFSLVITAM